MSRMFMIFVIFSTFTLYTESETISKVPENTSEKDAAKLFEDQKAAVDDLKKTMEKRKSEMDQAKTAFDNAKKTQPNNSTVFEEQFKTAETSYKASHSEYKKVKKATHDLADDIITKFPQSKLSYDAAYYNDVSANDISFGTPVFNEITVIFLIVAVFLWNV